MRFSARTYFDLAIVALLLYLVYASIRKPTPVPELRQLEKEIAIRDSVIATQMRALLGYQLARDSIAHHYYESTPDISTDSALLAFFAARYKHAYPTHEGATPDSLRAAPVR
jgi:hypothetical protein